MKKTKTLIIYLKIISINLLFSSTILSQSTTNIALTSTPSTSYVSPWETLEAVNDGYQPSSSSDNSNGAYGNWNGTENYNTWNWVEYDFGDDYQIYSTDVYWWDDGAGIDQPTDAYIEYWNGSSWTNAGSIGLSLNQWNTLTFNLATSRIRVNMISAMATGILEWQVFGESAQSCEPITITPYIQINDGSWSQTNDATLDVGDKIKFGPWPTSGGSWSWSGPDGFTASTREVTIENIQSNQSGTYTAVYTNDCGSQSSQDFTVTVNGGSATNIALTATVSTSYVSPWETLSAVNDDSNPSNSNDKSSGAYGNWDNPNTLEWVQYDWSSSYNISKTEVYWFDDNGGVLTPTTAYVEYWNGSSWVYCGDVPKVKDTWNELTISGVTTISFRISMLNTSQSTGILEWRVWGTLAGGGDTQAPTTPGTPSASNITSSSCTLTWTASTDNVGVTGYQVLKDGSPITTVSGTIASITGLSSATTYAFTIKAYDAAENYSAESGATFVTTLSGGGSGDPYTWPSYSPNISYNFKDEYGDVPIPANILDDCTGVVGTQSSGWWTFRWGASANPLVTSAAITPMLERYNTDFAYFRDVMGWPPDIRPLNGYKSAIYLYGSGLCTDNASNTELGGWQSSVYYNGTSWPIVLASYYPVYSFDPSCTYSDKVAQQGAMIHEGIHCVLASLPGCRDAAWFHEGGNTWLQQEADSRRSGDYSSMGFLNAAAMIAPFMPIECYSGWLQDGSFGGPSAEGVNMYSGSTQICTWKNLLGGTQYGNIFPTFLGQALDDGAVPWIWKYCTSRVLEGMAAGLGDEQIRRLICEYRAKQATIDFGVWNSAITALLNANMGITIQEEWSPYNIDCDPWTATPYVATTNSGGTLTPAYWTTPGWSGANQIPLTVSGSSVMVNFQPIGANMRCQLCYIASDGSHVYSQIVSSGNCSLNLTKTPANNVIIAVISNTDYIYYGESTRTAHYDYRLQLVSGISGAADINTAWYRGPSLLSAKTISDNFIDMSKYCSHSHNINKPSAHENQKMVVSEDTDAAIYPNPLTVNGLLNIEFSDQEGQDKLIEIVNAQGQVLYSHKVTDNMVTIDAKGILKKGIYFILIQSSDYKRIKKILVE